MGLAHTHTHINTHTHTHINTHQDTHAANRYRDCKCNYRITSVKAKQTTRADERATRIVCVCLCVVHVCVCVWGLHTAARALVGSVLVYCETCCILGDR